MQRIKVLLGPDGGILENLLENRPRKTARDGSPGPYPTLPDQSSSSSSEPSSPTAWEIIGVDPLTVWGQGALSATPGLTKLCLSECEVADWPYDLMHSAEAGLLPGLVSLQHLSVNWVNPKWRGKEYQKAEPPDALVKEDLLSHLVHLTHLSLSGPNKGIGYSSAQHHVCHLTALRELRLDVELWDTFTAEAVAGLQQLTWLELGSAVGYALELEPDALAGLTNLERLVLHQAKLPGEDDDEHIESIATFLRHLAQLQHLTQLQLHNMFADWGVDVQARAFSALTASSRLQHLDLRKVRLPWRVWPHVFTSDRPRPTLTTLTVNSCAYQGFARMDMEDDGLAVWEDATHIAVCCSNLRRLELVNERHSVGIAPLVQLGQLTTLSISDTDDAEIVDVLVRMTGLQQLHIVRPNNVSELGLLQLTQLRQLTELRVYLAQDVSRELRFVGAGSDWTPVWTQLLHHCMHSKDPIMRHVAWQSSATQQQQLAGLQQQLDTQRADPAQLRQEMNRLLAQVGRLRRA